MDESSLPLKHLKAHVGITHLVEKELRISMGVRDEESVEMSPSWALA